VSPKAFGAFGLKANSLLVYGALFRGAVGEALLALLATSAKYQARVACSGQGAGVMWQ
jgi:hypothetical protein